MLYGQAHEKMSVITNVKSIHVQIQRGPDPPPLLKNHQNIVFLNNTCPDLLKNYKATMPAFIVGPTYGTPVKRHLHGVSRAGR